MTVYKQISQILNLITQLKKEIIIIVILVNGLSILYYKNLEKRYYSNLIITAMPNIAKIKPVDIYSIFESYFRDINNFNTWKNLNKNNNENLLIKKSDIEGYQIIDGELSTNNKLVFRNAMTLQRSIYLTVPAEDSKYVKDIFLYAQFIEKKLNSLNFTSKDENMSQELKLMLERFNINYNIDLKLDLTNEEELLKFFKTLKDQGISLNQEKNKKNEENPFPFVKVSPPKSTYTNAISINKVLFSSILLSIFLICALLFYKDFKRFRRN